MPLNLSFTGWRRAWPGAAAAARRQAPALPGKVLFFSHDAKLGDAVVNTAFVAGLNRMAPACQIHATVAGCTDGFWRRDARLGTLWPLQQPGFRDIIKLGLALRRERYDYIVTWHKMRSEKNRLLLWLARPKRVIDLQAFNRGDVCHKIESCGEALRQMLRGVAAPAARREGERALAYELPRPERCAELDRLLDGAPAPGRPLIVVNLFAGDHWRNIATPDAVAVLRGLRALAPGAVLGLVCSGATAAAAAEAATLAAAGAVLFNCEQNLERLIDLCARASLIITPDTSLVHIGSAFETPVIGIFQNNGAKAVQWGPRSRLHGLVYSAHADSIAGFSVPQLLEQADALLRAAGSGA